MSPMDAPPNCGTEQMRSGPEEGRSSVLLLAEAELRDEAGVAALVLATEIVEERAALVDQHQKAATAMVVLRMALEVLGQVVDALREDRDLDFRRTGVARTTGMFLDQRGLA